MPEPDNIDPLTDVPSTRCHFALFFATTRVTSTTARIAFANIQIAYTDCPAARRVLPLLMMATPDAVRAMPRI